MIKYMDRLKKLLRHKWYVIIAGSKISIPWWRLLIHDLDKIIPRKPNHRVVNGTVVSKLSHRHKSKHHWEHWLTIDKFGLLPLEMPRQYVFEMVADWMAKEYEYNKSWYAGEFYARNVRDMTIHKKTSALILAILFKHGYDHYLGRS